LLFENNQIVGILDFGYAKSGTAAQELRLLPCINKLLLENTIDQYSNLGGLDVDPNEVHIWAISTQLASYCDRLSKGQTDHPSYIRSRENLKHLINKYSNLF